MSGKLTRIADQPIALSDMDVGQLESANTMLDQLAKLHDHANTAARILQGIVLLELKRQLGHSKWGPWLKKHFKKSQDTAGRCMRAAKDFLTKFQDPKFRSTAEFNLDAGADILRQDLAATLKQLEGAKLDLSHPLVRAASLYAGGRSFYQLCLELGDAERGGDTSTKRKKKTAEEKHQEFLKECRDDFAAAMTRVDSLVDNGHWKAPSITDAELEASAEVAQQFVKQVRAWLNTPKNKRTTLEEKS